MKEFKEQVSAFVFQGLASIAGRDTSFIVKSYNSATQMYDIIIVCRNDACDEVLAYLANLKALDGKHV
jgi:hypothetical protein